MRMGVQIGAYNNHQEVKIVLMRAQELCRQLSDDEKLPAQEINIIFVDDDFLKKLHRDFFDEDTYTDVITFDLSEPGSETVEGEIYISLDRAKFYAGEFSVSLQEEIARLIIHGILHLNGYDDQTEIQRKKMRQLENSYIEKYADIIQRL